MKMHRQDYIALKNAIDSLSRDALAVNWLAYKAKGLSQERFRWDVLWASKFNINPLYSELNDDHIDTALRQIMKGIVS